MHYRLLQPENDLDAFQKLRLRACKEEPVAFTESYEELLNAAPEGFARYFKNGWIAGTFEGDVLVGMAGLYKNTQEKIAHKGTVWGVYCAPEIRGKGASRNMLQLLLEEAQRDGLEIIHLSTDAQNKTTVGLYQSMGFVPWGVDEHFAKVSGRYVHEVMMKKYLRVLSND